MKVTLTQFEPNVPLHGPFREGKDYQGYEYDVGYGEAVLLLERLKVHRSHLFMEGKYSNLDFNINSDDSLSVEIFDARDGFWAISEVDLVAAKEIIRMANEGEQFSNFIPTTEQTWGSYGMSNTTEDGSQKG